MLSARASIIVLAPTSVIYGFQPTIGHGWHEQLAFKSYSMKCLFWCQSGRINVQHHSAHVWFCICSELTCRLPVIACAELNQTATSATLEKVLRMSEYRNGPSLFTKHFPDGPKRYYPQSTQHHIIIEARPCAMRSDPSNTPITPWNACQTCEATSLPLPKLQSNSCSSHGILKETPGRLSSRR